MECALKKMNESAVSVRIAITAVLAVSLNACSGLLTAETPVFKRYTLLQADPAEASVSKPAGEGRSLLVQVGSVGLSLTSDRMLARNGLTIAPISELRWVENTPDMLEKSLTDYLQRSDKFDFVTSDRRGPETDQVLIVDLTALFVLAEGGRATAVQIGLAARLFTSRSGKGDQAPRTFVIYEDEPIERSTKSNIDDEIAEAFNRAAVRAFGQFTN